MNPPVIHPVFPSPIFTALLERGLTDEERRAIAACDRDALPVMEDHALASFTRDVIRYVDLYFHRVVMPLERVEARVIKSRVVGRLSRPGDTEGVYGAGYISGVFCVDASPGNYIEFVSNAPDIYPVDKVAANPFNAQQFKVEIERGQIVLFPHTMNCRINIGPGDDDAVILFSAS